MEVSNKEVRSLQRRILFSTFVVCVFYYVCCFLLEPVPDEVTQICEINSLYKENPKSYHLHSEEKWTAYVDSCKEVWSDLDDPLRKVLRHALRVGSLVRYVDYTWGPGANNADPLTCGGNARFKQPTEIIATAREEYLKAGIAPLFTRTVPLSEVPTAIMHGETVLFNGRDLLPPRFFNISFQKLADLHTNRGRDIPCMEGNGMRRTKGGQTCSDLLHYFTNTIPTWGVRSIRAQVARRVVAPFLLAYVCPDRFYTMNELAEMSINFHKQEVPHRNFVKNAKKAFAKQQSIRKQTGGDNQLIGVTNCNMFRLPNYSFDIGNALFPGDVEHTHSLLWAGQQGGGMHSDYQDNVIIQVHGSAEVVIFPANCSPIAQRLPNQVTIRDWVTEGMPKGKVRAPYHHLRLEEGQGVVIPSRAFHKIVSQYSSRMAINAFMEPKWGRMRWNHSPFNYFRREDNIKAGMRLLWLKSMRRAWQVRKQHYYMHTDRNDYL